MTNRYAGTCGACGTRVPARGGVVLETASRGQAGNGGGRWEVRHLTCQDGTPRVVETVFSSGRRVTRNAQGLCEDAPCCGCCTG